jgi:RNA polymerase sigma-70 factor (ECF subfamily)
MTPGIAAGRHAERLPSDVSRLPALMARIAAGDHLAFAAFYELLAPRVWRLVVSVVGDGELAREVAREAFTAMWVQASRCPTDADGPLVWAMGIAYHHARQRTQTPDRDSRGSRERPGQNTNSVCGKMSPLTADQHAALVLGYYGALTWSQAARATARPAPTIARAQRDALIRLRDMPPTATRRTAAGRPSPFPRRTQY